MATQSKSSQLLVAVLGPTSSGKTALAAKATRLLRGEIVNCDSMQMYRLLEIGTGKPTPEQMAEVPHHLYDRLDPEEHYSAGRYMVEARRVCGEIAQRGRLPFVVGGTGLYLRALLEGIFEGPDRCKTVRLRLQQIGQRKGFDYLYALLQRKDSTAASRIHPQDHVRVIRSLEVYFLTGSPLSRLQAQKEPLHDFRIIKVGLDLPRATLYDRIDRRVSQMFQLGLVREVELLVEQGFTVECKAFEALGYKNAAAVVVGDSSLDEAIQRTQAETRRYAKRQMTWFRREKNVNWIQTPGENPETLEHLLRLVEQVQSC